MSSYLTYIPAIREFFPPTPFAYSFLQTIFKTFPVLSIVQWLSPPTPMGRTSSTSRTILNLPGRYAWAIAEMVGPINLTYILYALPSRLHPLSSTTTTISPSTGLFGTGLPITHEILGLLYLIHYVNRAVITPLFVAPSMSPILGPVALLMALFQFTNSTSIGGWICYDAQRRILGLSDTKIDGALISPWSIIGLVLFIGGLAGNIAAERHLFSLRVAAAKRQARSEGKAVVTYDKVYVVPEAKGLFTYVMYPHYSLEWVEWVGYWILGGAWGLGWSWHVSAALMFLVNEICSMTPRAVEGLGWYEKRFGKRAVAGRKAVVPGLL